MTISNYQTIVSDIETKYITNINNGKTKDLKTLNDEVTKTLIDLKNLKKANPSYSLYIDDCIKRMNIIQGEYNKKINKIRSANKDKLKGGIKNSRKVFGFLHNLTEAPVDDLKRHMGLK